MTQKGLYIRLILMIQLINPIKIKLLILFPLLNLSLPNLLMLTSASFKHQKLNRSMDLKSTGSKTQSTIFTPRMSAFNSIAKSVKYNNLQFITGEELCKLRRQPQQPSDNPQFSTAKNNMTNIKKRYDHTNHQKLYLENKLQRLNEEKAKYLVLTQQFQTNKSSGKNKVTHLENQLESIKLNLLDKDFQKMSMLQMRDVIVHDKIVYDKKKYDLEKELHKIIFKSNSIKETNLHQAEEDDRTFKVYEKLISKLESQNQERQQHINSIESRVMEKQGVHNSSVLRKSQMMDIAQTTMCERDPEEKDWINIFLTHKLLKDLLQSKIEREMQKFSEVENAFKNIKIETGVNDTQTLVKKFLSKEEVYGDLLSKITENEREIQLLRMDKERHLKEIKKTEEELQELETIKTYDEDLREWLKQAEYYDERKRRSEFQDMKLKQYLFKQLKRLNGETDKDAKSTKEDVNSLKNDKLKLNSKEQIKESFINHLKNLSQLIDESQKLQIKQISNDKEDANGAINENALSKVFRVKPYIKASSVSTNDKNVSEEYVQAYEEEEITTANDEVEAIDEQRVALIKSNEKFMKELKRKLVEQKQLMVETLVKNAKDRAAPVPVKKVQVPQE